MAQRPNFIDLRSASQSSNISGASRPLRSPRLHIAGEAPPELSPLDAFAMQSRLLAKQLEETARGGRRVSRLPPLTTESPVVKQGRSEYFRSMSCDSASDAETSPQQLHGSFGIRTEVEDSPERPKSMHPRMSRVPPTPEEPLPLPPRLSDDIARRLQMDAAGHPDDDGFGSRREPSPSPVNDGSMYAREDSDEVEAGETANPPRSPANPPKSSSEPNGLAPPRPVFPKRSSSIMSAPVESTTGEEGDFMSDSFLSQPLRTLSAGSRSGSPAVAPYQRSPSIASEASAVLPRPSFNFSRPMSRSGTPGPETPSRQASYDSQPCFILADDTASTPISMSSEGFPDGVADDGKSAAPSYIYSKFSLPRGKLLQRLSAHLAGGHSQASFVWEQPMVPPSNVQTIPRGGQAPPSPPTRPSSSSGAQVSGDASRPSLERGKLSTEVVRPTLQLSPNPSRPSTESSRTSEDGPRGRGLVREEPVRQKTAVSIATTDSTSTIKAPRSLHSVGASTTSEMTAEEHVAKSIKLHEDGKLNESTYHLRLAARQNHPTGMLLYALACRHGWGMRPNQREGVQWLRRAADMASHEIADDEGQIKEGKSVDFLERKTRKAQFALSIYELGVSHMNGWGIEQDKALALRCFEIAGSWGDIDALAEAGFCYAQGIGCKKNLKKSAKFYRMAEAKGMSMVGNSWIHKAKYNDDENDSSSTKKTRSKSRSRNIFGIKNHS